MKVFMTFGYFQIEGFLSLIEILSYIRFRLEELGKSGCIFIFPVLCVRFGWYFETPPAPPLLRNTKQQEENVSNISTNFG